jgi:hypothetical protein
VTVSHNVLLSAFRPNYMFRVEPAGGEQKSADVERKTVMLIYPYLLEILTSHIRSHLGVKMIYFRHLTDFGHIP